MNESPRPETHRAARPRIFRGPRAPPPPSPKRGRRLMLVEERKKCYEARDAYFSCLDANGGRRQKRALRKLYEKHCPPSWVKHFDKKREEDEKLRKLLEAKSDAETKTSGASNAGK